MDWKADLPYSICSGCKEKHLAKGYQEDIGICYAIDPKGRVVKEQK